MRSILAGDARGAGWSTALLTRVACEGCSSRPSLEEPPSPATTLEVVSKSPVGVGSNRRVQPEGGDSGLRERAGIWYRRSRSRRWSAYRRCRWSGRSSPRGRQPVMPARSRSPSSNSRLAPSEGWTSSADSEISLRWPTECPPISCPFALSVSRSARFMCRQADE